MTSWTGHAALLPAQATWHGHGKQRFVRQRTAHMETTLSKKADTAMYEDEDDDRFEAAVRLAEVDPA
jgi:hypothetical protein